MPLPVIDNGPALGRQLDDPKSLARAAKAHNAAQRRKAPLLAEANLLPQRTADDVLQRRVSYLASSRLLAWRMEVEARWHAAIMIRGARKFGVETRKILEKIRLSYNARDPAYKCDAVYWLIRPLDLSEATRLQELTLHALEVHE
jgi:hypothetical protein